MQTEFCIIRIGETLFYVPVLSVLNAFGFRYIGLQVSVLMADIAAFVLLIVISIHRSIKNFEKIDLWNNINILTVEHPANQNSVRVCSAKQTTTDIWNPGCFASFIRMKRSR